MSDPMEVDAVKAEPAADGDAEVKVRLLAAMCIHQLATHTPLVAPASTRRQTSRLSRTSFTLICAYTPPIIRATTIRTSIFSHRTTFRCAKRSSNAVI
jgi:hypothetical protein